jgi:serine/threonine protein kinase
MSVCSINSQTTLLSNTQPVLSKEKLITDRFNLSDTSSISSCLSSLSSSNASLIIQDKNKNCFVINRWAGRPIEVLPLTAKQLLGTGGFGTVYKLSPKDMPPVAIKIANLPKDMDDPSEEYCMENVLAEYESLRKLHEEEPVEGVQGAPISKVWKISNLREIKTVECGFIGPYYKDGSLKALLSEKKGDFLNWAFPGKCIAKGTLDRNTGNGYIKQLIEANLKLKEKRLANTDLKPANVFVDGSQVVIGDLSLVQTVPVDGKYKLPRIIHTDNATPAECLSKLKALKKEVQSHPESILEIQRELEKVTISQLGLIAYQVYYGAKSIGENDLTHEQIIKNFTPPRAFKSDFEREVYEYILKMIDITSSPDLTLESVLDQWNQFAQANTDALQLLEKETIFSKLDDVSRRVFGKNQLAGMVPAWMSMSHNSPRLTFT